MFTIWNALWYIINLLINLDGMIVKGKNAFIFYKDHTTAWTSKVSGKWTKNMWINDRMCCQQLFYH